MWDWKDQNTEMLNEAGFKVSDPGRLHAPILSFKIRRDEHLQIVLETRDGTRCQFDSRKDSIGNPAVQYRDRNARS